MKIGGVLSTYQDLEGLALFVVYGYQKAHTKIIIRQSWSPSKLNDICNIYFVFEMILGGQNDHLKCFVAFGPN